MIASFFRKLKTLYQWHNVRLLLASNSMISLFLIILGFSGHRSLADLPIISLYLFIIVQSVGFAIYSWILLSRIFHIQNVFIRWFLLILTIPIAGWAGFIIGIIVAPLICGQPIDISFSARQIVNKSFQFLLLGLASYAFFAAKFEFRAIIQKLAAKELQAEKLERLKTRAELNTLRAKVNPHFLFNTLNSIASLIPVDPEKAEELTSQLSSLFRYTLQVADEEKLEEELEIARKYLEIEKVRLGQRLSYAIECETDCKEVRIPGLLIQPLVENSVKHGIAPLPRGGHIDVQCEKQNGYCVIRIRDNGKGFPETGFQENFGLGGVRERLQLMYGNSHALSIENVDGVTVTIRVPLNNA